jgi:hypothetical protein
MPFILESSFQKSGSRYSKEDSMQIPTQRNWIPRFRPEGQVMRSDAHQCLEDSNSSRLHPSGRHGNMSGRSSKFHNTSWQHVRHIYGKTAASVWTTGQHRPDTVLIMVITCHRSVTVRTIRQHHPDMALIWNRVEYVMESRSDSCPSGLF